MFASRPHKLAAAIIGFFVGLVGASVARDAWLARQHGPPASKAAATSLGEAGVAFALEGRDAAGRAAAFELVVPGRWLAWSADGTFTIDGHPAAPRDVARRLLTPPLRERLRAVSHVIAAAALPGEAPEAADLHRSGLRAERAARLMAEETAAAATPVWALNLGGYAAPCAACESKHAAWPAAFLLVLVPRVEAGCDLGQALAAALSNRVNIPAPASFTAFGLTRVR
jgi:hypothetical protein